VRVKVLYFGVLRELFGVSDEAVELRDEATVGELLGLLRGRTSNGSMGNGTKSELSERLWMSLAVAVNREYESTSIVLRDGDEVALLPPVSGGCFAHGEKLALLASAQCIVARFESEWLS
jgi:molybdopterin converting factor subunit 1